MKARFAWDKSTKGTERYKEIVPEGEHMLVGTLYVKKTAIPLLGSTVPAEIEVTVEAVT